MITIAKDWVAQMKTGNLSESEIWVALKSMVWRTLSYPLLALNLTRNCQAVLL